MALPVCSCLGQCSSPRPLQQLQQLVPPGLRILSRREQLEMRAAAIMMMGREWSSDSDDFKLQASQARTALSLLPTGVCCPSASSHLLHSSMPVAAVVVAAALLV